MHLRLPRYALPGSLRRRLAEIRRLDPAFSLILLEDFLYSLYAEARHAMGRGQIATLSAYIAPDVLARMGAGTARGGPQVSNT